MAKQPKFPMNQDLKPYPGSERFGDWDFGENSNVIWHNTDEKLVADADNTEPNPIANVPKDT